MSRQDTHWHMHAYVYSMVPWTGGSDLRLISETATVQGAWHIGCRLACQTTTYNYGLACMAACLELGSAGCSVLGVLTVLHGHRSSLFSSKASRRLLPRCTTVVVSAASSRCGGLQMQCHGPILHVREDLAQRRIRALKETFAIVQNFSDDVGC